jgi:poly-gamma-glutamate system protein
MAFRPHLRSIWTLLVLAALCYGLFLWADASRIQAKKDYYEEKIAATELADQALRALASRESVELERTESFGDSRLDAVIGQQFSTITDELGSFEAKLVGSNPNFAAIFVDQLKSAGLNRDDFIAVAMTASNPGANIAFLSACQTLGIRTKIVSTVASSWWGANDPEYTWLDMYKHLNARFFERSEMIAASIGGLDDNGAGLSSQGRNEAIEACARTGVTLLRSEGLMQAGILWWRTLTSSLPSGSTYKAYVNLGEGLASLGHAENGALIDDGVNRKLPRRNWPARGAVHVASESGLPVIQIFDIARMARIHGLGTVRIPLPPNGTGEVFSTERYDMRVSVTALVIALAVMIFMIRLDAKYFRLPDAGVDPETLM